MLARGRLSPCSFPLRKPQCLFGLFGSDRVRPWRFKAESACSFLGGAFCGCFDNGAEGIAHQTGVFAVGIIDAPKLVAGFRSQSRCRAHGAQFSTTGACEDVSATQNARTVPGLTRLRLGTRLRTTGTDPFTDDVHVLPKHFAELDRSKPLVASIYITPDAKLMPN